MKGWFMTLNERERISVSIAAIFMFLAIVWFGIWQPLNNGHERARDNVENWRQSLAALRPLKGQIQNAGANQPTNAGQNQSLVVIVDNSLRQRGLYDSLQRSQPTPAGNGIRVEFESAAFDDLILWLGDLHRQYGLSVEAGSFSTSSSDTPGRVNSSVTLER